MDWTHLEESDDDNDSRTPYLMLLPTALIECCFKFLSDEDLMRAGGTCKFFLSWFCKLYRGGFHAPATDCLSFIGPCKMGLYFESITHLNFQLPFQSFDFKHFTCRNFPKVTSITLNYVNVGSMPTNGNVRDLNLVGCRFYGRRPGKKQRQFPFYNVRNLRIESGTPLSETCPLPIFRKLRSLTIIDTVFQHGITKRRFPCLATVELRGEDTLVDFPNLRCPRVRTLVLSHSGLFPIRRENQFHSIQSLKLYITNELIQHNPIIRRLEASHFPSLKKLEFDFGVRRFFCDLSFLQPLPSLDTLRVNMIGSIEAFSLTQARFPSLRHVILNADGIDLATFPSHNNLRTLILPRNARNPEVFENLYLWPRLRQVQPFREDMVLSLCEGDDVLVRTDEDMRPVDVAERNLNSMIEELWVEYDARAARISEENLREERLRRSDAPEMSLGDDIEGLDASD